MSREIEVKLLADGVQPYEVKNLLTSELFGKCSSYEEGSSIDLYWKPAYGTKAQFIRLRSSQSTLELTSKVNDKGDISDRLEYNVPIYLPDRDNITEMLTGVLGDPTAIMWTYADFKMGPGVTISVVFNIEKMQWTFVEIEASSQAEVDFWTKKLKDAAQFDLKEVKNSFYDIFVIRHGVLL